MTGETNSRVAAGWQRRALLAATGLLLCAALPCQASSLQAYAVDNDKVTISGISSGAYMAVQMHVAYSSLFRGAGIVAGGPYYCAQGDVETALHACMADPTQIDVDYLETVTASTAASGDIDDTSHLADARVWMFSGAKDSVVHQGVMHALVKYYTSFLKSPTQLNATFDVPAEHSMVTDDFGNACSHLGEPYINNCDFDAAGKLLQWILPSKPLLPPTAPAGKLSKFDQTEFLLGAYTASTAGVQDDGYIYVPSSGCKDSSDPCLLHFAFHGCLQSDGKIGETFVKNAGYLQWAESNNIIVVFPQAASNTLNPKGCWDWWGYTGEDYASQLGVQTNMVYSMAQRIMGQS